MTDICVQYQQYGWEFIIYAHQCRWGRVPKGPTCPWCSKISLINKTVKLEVTKLEINYRKIHFSAKVQGQVYLSLSGCRTLCVKTIEGSSRKPGRWTLRGPLARGRHTAQALPSLPPPFLSGDIPFYRMMPLLSEGQVLSSRSPTYSEQSKAPWACFDSLPGSWGGWHPDRMWMTMPWTLGLREPSR